MHNTPATVSHTVMYLSLSIEHDPNFTYSGVIDWGGLTTYIINKCKMQNINKNDK